MLLVNYGVHSTLWAGTQYLSADFPGEAVRFVEERSQTGEYEARREDTVALHARLLWRGFTSLARAISELARSSHLLQER